MCQEFLIYGIKGFSVRALETQYLQICFQKLSIHVLNSSHCQIAVTVN